VQQFVLQQRLSQKTLLLEPSTVVLMDNASLAALVERIVQRRCVLFLGPDAAETADGYLGLPNSGQLALELAERCGHRGGYKPLPQIAQIYEHELSRFSLLDYLRQRLDQPAYRPLPIHELIARVPFSAIVHAGWDMLLEQALQGNGVPYEVVQSAVKIPYVLPTQKLVIYKPYGSVDQPDAMIITEDDQLGVFYQLQSLKRHLTDLIAANSLLMIGYAPDYDSVLVRIYHEIRQEQQEHRPPSFVVESLSRPEDAAQWEARGFQPLVAEPTPFLYALAAAVAQAEGRALSLPSVDLISQAPRATEQDLAAYSETMTTVFDKLGVGRLVEQSDVLLLTPDQVRDLEAMRAAYERLAHTLEPEPGAAQVWLRQGNVEYARHNVTAARGYYEQALAAQPDLAEAHYNLHYVFLAQNNLDAALQAYQQAVARRPELALLPPRYRIDGVLGRGGIGVVYRAVDAQTGQLVAVKLLDRAYMRTEQAIRRLRREAEILQRLDHPHIVRYIDFQQHQGRYFLVMEYLGAQTLAKLLAERGCLPIDDADVIVQQACNAVSFAHQQGIIHRDLKPANVFLSDGQVKLIDFGLAVEMAAGQPSVSDLPAGTVAYMAPEQAAGGPVDARTDVYALATITYELLTGFNPGQGAYRPPGDLVSGINDALGIVLEKARDRQPERRYADAADFLAAWTSVARWQPASQRAPAWLRALGRLQQGLRRAVSRFWWAWVAVILLSGLLRPTPLAAIGFLLGSILSMVMLADWFTTWLARRSDYPLLASFGPVLGLVLGAALWAIPVAITGPGELGGGGEGSYLDYTFFLLLDIALAVVFGGLSLLALSLSLSLAKRLRLGLGGHIAAGIVAIALVLAVYTLFFLANF
jgi:tetratricopeptide (TPR) repeat protein